MHARTLLEGWYRAAADHLPAERWDAHTHTGDRDPDGVTNNAGALLEALDRAGHTGAVVCSSLDPDGYRAANDRILTEATDAGGRLIPFLRVNPAAADAAAEVERCLDAGHRGVKLHPRGERFDLEHPGIDRIAAIASERRVPVLIHAGRGMPALGAPLLGLIDRHPRLAMILAHCAISDLDSLLPVLGDLPGVHIDTAWWNAVDVAAVMGGVDARQILYASDTPYGSSTTSTVRTLRAARQAGHGADAVEAIFGGNLQRLLSGEPLGEPLGVGRSTPVETRTVRVISYLTAAINAGLSGGDATEAAELALRACDGISESDVVGVAMRASIEAFLGLGSPASWRLRFSLLMMAASAAMTPAAGPPT